jgi:hypothetical protein
MVNHIFIFIFSYKSVTQMMAGMPNESVTQMMAGMANESVTQMMAGMPNEICW